MFKRIVALVCVTVLCLTMVSEALAECVHSFVWINTGVTMMRPISDSLHQRHIMFEKMCTKCNKRGIFEFLADPNSPTSAHTSNGVYQGYHVTGTYYHVLYLVCNVCEHKYDYHDNVLCPGNGAHVVHP